MRTCIYPGSFDPVTNGHLDLIERACRLFDRVVVALAVNDEKKPFFSKNERLDFMGAAVADFENCEVVEFDGLLVDFAREIGAVAVVRGLRAVSDFEFEFQMALMNRKLAPDIETVFMMPRDEYIYVSSSLVREIARFGGDVTAFVPSQVAAELQKKSGVKKEKIKDEVTKSGVQKHFTD